MTRTGSLTPAKLLTLVSLLVIVGVEVFAVAISAGWALAGLFDLGTSFGYALMALFSALGAYVLWGFWRRAAAVESPGS